MRLKYVRPDIRFLCFEAFLLKGALITLSGLDVGKHRVGFVAASVNAEAHVCTECGTESVDSGPTLRFKCCLHHVLARKSGQLLSLSGSVPHV